MLSWDYNARQISTQDFEGAANIFLTSSGMDKLREVSKSYPIMEDSGVVDLFRDDYLDINLVINNVSYSYKEHNQLVPLMGDKFFHFFYGKSPLVLRLQGAIFNTSGRKGSPEFSILYKYLLRLSMVTKTHIVPNIEFRNCIASGAFLSFTKNQTAQAADYVKFSAEVLAFRLDYTNTENNNQQSVEIRYFEEPATEENPDHNLTMAAREAFYKPDTA